eukprot:gene2211-6737_t
MGFARGTAPGPSGLRAQHLQDAVESSGGDAVVEQLTAVTNLLARGDAPAELAPHLAGASLIALAKKDGGVRPIAVGVQQGDPLGPLFFALAIHPILTQLAADCAAPPAAGAGAPAAAPPPAAA